MERTAALWPDIERVYGWAHRAARILGNERGEDAVTVRRRFDSLVAAMARHRSGAGGLAGAVDHFRKVARSYRPGLFRCCAVPGLPRTNNGLEQTFGSQRYHERRATGRRTASPAAVLRGEEPHLALAIELDMAVLLDLSTQLGGSTDTTTWLRRYWSMTPTRRSLTARCGWCACSTGPRPFRCCTP